MAPFFGDPAPPGKDDMTKYFLKDTPLAGLERQMMTPPNSIPRGGGQMVLCQFRYRPEDVDCKICTEYRKRHCASQVCPWLEERAEAGVVTYSALASVFYERWMDGMLGNGFERYFQEKNRSPIMTTATLTACKSAPHIWSAVVKAVPGITGWRPCTC